MTDKAMTGGATTDGATTGGAISGFDAPAPPAGFDPARQALWWLGKGGLAPGPDWDRAHAICQRGEGARGCDLVHGLAHLIEGDLGYAEYWYRRAGERPSAAGAAAEWDRVAALIGREP